MRISDWSSDVCSSDLFGGAGDPDGNLILSIDNPFLKPAARDTIIAALASNPDSDSQDTFLLGRANTDLTSGSGASTVELYRFVGGLDGTFPALGKEMKFEGVGNSTEERRVGEE